MGQGIARGKRQASFKGSINNSGGFMGIGVARRGDRDRQQDRAHDTCQQSPRM